MFPTISADVSRTYELATGSRFHRFLECARSPGVQATIVFRLGHWLLSQHLLSRIFLVPLYVLLHHHVRSTWGILIQRRAELGPGLYIGHFGGIFVHEDVHAGSNLTLSQNVTIGISGEGVHRGTPVLGNNVRIAPGAIVVGKIRVGNGVHVGPNAVVLRNLPDNTLANASPLRVVSFAKPEA
jgi:serine O-acetyltransferase